MTTLIIPFLLIK